MLQIKLVGTDSVEVEDVQPESGSTAHILIPAYPNNDYADIRPAALLKLTPSLAKRLLRRMEGVKKLANELDDETSLDEAVYFDYTPTWIDRSAFDCVTEGLDILDEHDNDLMLLTVDQAAQVEACPGAEVRVEMSRLHVSCGPAGYAGNVYWTMRPKYTEYIVDCGMIPEDVLRRIAGQQ